MDEIEKENRDEPFEGQPLLGEGERAPEEEKKQQIELPYLSNSSTSNLSKEFDDTKLQNFLMNKKCPVLKHGYKGVKRDPEDKHAFYCFYCSMEEICKSCFEVCHKNCPKYLRKKIRLDLKQDATDFYCCACGLTLGHTPKKASTIEVDIDKAINRLIHNTNISFVKFIEIFDKFKQELVIRGTEECIFDYDSFIKDEFYSKISISSYVDFFDKNFSLKPKDISKTNFLLFLFIYMKLNRVFSLTKRFTFNDFKVKNWYYFQAYRSYLDSTVKNQLQNDNPELAKAEDREALKKIFSATMYERIQIQFLRNNKDPDKLDKNKNTKNEPKQPKSKQAIIKKVFSKDFDEYMANLKIYETYVEFGLSYFMFSKKVLLMIIEYIHDITSELYVQCIYKNKKAYFNIVNKLFELQYEAVQTYDFYVISKLSPNEEMEEQEQSISEGIYDKARNFLSDKTSKLQDAYQEGGIQKVSDDMADLLKDIPTDRRGLKKKLKKFTKKFQRMLDMEKDDKDKENPIFANQKVGPTAIVSMFQLLDLLDKSKVDLTPYIKLIRELYFTPKINKDKMFEYPEIFDFSFQRQLYTIKLDIHDYMNKYLFILEDDKESGDIELVHSPFNEEQIENLYQRIRKIMVILYGENFEKEKIIVIEVDKMINAMVTSGLDYTICLVIKFIFSRWKKFEPTEDKKEEEKKETQIEIEAGEEEEIITTKPKKKEEEEKDPYRAKIKRLIIWCLDILRFQTNNPNSKENTDGKDFFAIGESFSIIENIVFLQKGYVSENLLEDEHNIKLLDKVYSFFFALPKMIRRYELYNKDYSELMMYRSKAFLPILSKLVEEFGVFYITSKESVKNYLNKILEEFKVNIENNNFAPLQKNEKFYINLLKIIIEDQTFFLNNNLKFPERLFGKFNHKTDYEFYTKYSKFSITFKSYILLVITNFTLSYFINPVKEARRTHRNQKEYDKHVNKIIGLFTILTKEFRGLDTLLDKNNKKENMHDKKFFAKHLIRCFYIVTNFCYASARLSYRPFLNFIELYKAFKEKDKMLAEFFHLNEYLREKETKKEEKEKNEKKEQEGDNEVYESKGDTEHKKEFVVTKLKTEDYEEEKLLTIKDKKQLETNFLAKDLDFDPIEITYQNVCEKIYKRISKYIDNIFDEIENTLIMDFFAKENENKEFSSVDRYSSIFYEMPLSDYTEEEDDTEQYRAYLKLLKKYIRHVNDYSFNTMFLKNQEKKGEAANNKYPPQNYAFSVFRLLERCYKSEDVVVILVRILSGENDFMSQLSKSPHMRVKDYMGYKTRPWLQKFEEKINKNDGTTDKFIALEENFSVLRIFRIIKQKIMYYFMNFLITSKTISGTLKDKQITSMFISYTQLLHLLLENFNSIFHSFIFKYDIDNTQGGMKEFVDYFNKIKEGRLSKKRAMKHRITLYRRPKEVPKFLPIGKPGLYYIFESLDINHGTIYEMYVEFFTFLSDILNARFEFGISNSVECPDNSICIAYSALIDFLVESFSTFNSETLLEMEPILASRLLEYSKFSIERVGLMASNKLIIHRKNEVNLDLFIKTRLFDFLNVYLISTDVSFFEKMEANNQNPEIFPEMYFNMICYYTENLLNKIILEEAKKAKEMEDIKEGESTKKEENFLIKLFNRFFLKKTVPIDIPVKSIRFIILFFQSRVNYKPYLTYYYCDEYVLLDKIFRFIKILENDYEIKEFVSKMRKQIHKQINHKNGTNRILRKIFEMDSISPQDLEKYSDEKLEEYIDSKYIIFRHFDFKSSFIEFNLDTQEKISKSIKQTQKADFVSFINNEKEKLKEALGLTPPIVPFNSKLSEEENLIKKKETDLSDIPEDEKPDDSEEEDELPSEESCGEKKDDMNAIINAALAPIEPPKKRKSGLEPGEIRNIYFTRNCRTDSFEKILSLFMKNTNRADHTTKIRSLIKATNIFAYAYLFEDIEDRKASTNIELYNRIHMAIILIVNFILMFLLSKPPSPKGDPTDFMNLEANNLFKVVILIILALAEMVFEVFFVILHYQNVFSRRVHTYLDKNSKFGLLIPKISPVDKGDTMYKETPQEYAKRMNIVIHKVLYKKRKGIKLESPQKYLYEIFSDMNKKNWIRKILIYFTYVKESPDLQIILFTFICNISYLYTLSHIFLAIPIVCIVYFIQTVLDVFLGLRKNAKSIALSFLFNFVILYFFMWVGLSGFNEQFQVEDSTGEKSEPLCTNSIQCLMTFVSSGLFNDGTSDMMNKKVSFKADPSKFTGVFFYNLLTFIAVKTIFGNVFTGLTTDAFSAFRKKTEHDKTDEENKCYICDLTNKKAAAKGIDFREHIVHHDIIKYVEFLINLFSKNKSDFTIHENLIFEQILDNKITWIPYEVDEIAEQPQATPQK